MSAPVDTSPSPSRTSPPPSNNDVTKAVDKASDSALQNLKRNARFLFSPANTSEQPARFRTRALLRSLHYLGRFLFWRLVRYAKYAAIAAIGAGVLGSFVSGVGFIVAPPTILASTGIGILWAVGSWGFRKAEARVRRVHQDEIDGKRPAREIPEPTLLEDTFA